MDKRNNILMSFWINRQAKRDFAVACKVNNSSMTAEINRHIRAYIAANKLKIDERTDMFGDVIDSRFFGVDTDQDTGW